MSEMQSLSGQSREVLATLVPEYLLAGHLIDRAGMPHVIGAFGREEMLQVAIEEWMGASPVYTRRMQRALSFEGDSVETIFKGMQLDVGAPPQFMDFRYRLTDHDHGEFWLDHCGALMDVEPMGPEYVKGMCHDIEDPTFDATATAVSPRAQVRPVHRPPRMPADRTPHCHWTVTIAPDAEPLPVPAEAVTIGATRAATLELGPIDPTGSGRHDYRGPLLADLDFTEWSASALRRIAEEVCLQGHLFSLAFVLATARRSTTVDQVAGLHRRQCTGVAGVVAERLVAALGLGTTLADVARLLALHPALLPAAYVDCRIEHDDRLRFRIAKDSPAMADGAWPATFSADHTGPLDAIVQAVDRKLFCEAVEDSDTALVFEVIVGDSDAQVPSDVTLTRFSTGADFRFEDRGTPVELRARSSRSG